MKKKEILSRVVEIANADSDKKITKVQAEKVIESFKQAMLECVENGEDFNYHGFVEVETHVVEPKERINPKTQETFMDTKKYKANIRFTYSIKQLIKKLTVK